MREMVIAREYILETLESHRSIRNFKPDPIPPEDVAKLMLLAQRASSGGMAQVYSVIRVTARSKGAPRSAWAR